MPSTSPAADGPDRDPLAATGPCGLLATLQARPRRSGVSLPGVVVSASRGLLCGARAAARGASGGGVVVRGCYEAPEPVEALRQRPHPFEFAMYYDI